MRQHFRLTERRGFTAVELAALIAVAAVLIALLAPAVQQARESARMAQCRNNLKQLGMAILNYESSYSAFPPGQGFCCPQSGGGGHIIKIDGGPCTTTMNWGISILPYLDLAKTYNLYNQNLQYSDPANTTAIATVIPAFICPSTPRSSNIATVAVTAEAITNVQRGNYLPYNLPYTATGGAADYIISSGVKAGEMEYLFPSGSEIIKRLEGGDSWGFGRPGLWWSFPNVDAQLSGVMTRQYLTDGASNTTMLFELAGRNTVYRADHKDAATHSSLAPDFDSAEIENQLAFGGGLWADPGNGDYFISGRRHPDGSGEPQGPYLINKSNMRESANGGGSFYWGNGCGPYSFHSDGVYTIMCDGSVRFLNDTMNNQVLCALAGAQDGMVTDDF